MSATDPSEARAAGDLGRWLLTIGLENLLPVFEENEVDFEALLLLSDADLKDLGLALGPRRKILNALHTTLETSGEALAGERRQVVALFCDMVGYTALSQRVDAEDLETIVRQYEDICTICVTRYEGYVFQMQGDGIIAVFGYPFAHEGEAERAIRTGLDMIKRIEGAALPGGDRLQVRIGIASGIVVVGSGRDRLTGDCLNLAARLEAAAEPGTILVSEEVRRLARGWFEYKDLGGLDFKGFAEPVRSFRVIGPSLAQTRFAAWSQISAPAMVGRDTENAMLVEMWDAIRRDQQGGAAILNGDPGIGKSRLLNSFASTVKARGASAISIQCSAFFGNSPYHPLKPLLISLAGVEDSDSDTRKLEKLTALVRDGMGGSKEEALLLASALSVPFSAEAGRIDLSAGAANQKTQSLIARILARNWSPGPTVLIYEDIHWADPSTLAVLKQQLEGIAETPVMIVAAHRPEFNAEWADLPGVRRISLGRLSLAESISLARSIGGKNRLSDAVIEHIAERADGVPLFVEELTRTILEALAARRDVPGMADAAMLDQLGLPGTLRELIMARLDRSPQAKEVAQIGAIIGREFSHGLVAQLDVVPEPQLTQALGQLMELGLAYRTGEGATQSYSFKHALVQDAARDSLRKSIRKTLHGKIARTLESDLDGVGFSAPEVLAHHFEAANLKLKAAQNYRKAGELAVRRFAVVEGTTYFRSALRLIAELAPSVEVKALELEVRKQLGPLIMAQHGWGRLEVAEVLEPALALARELDHRSSFLPVLNTLNVHYFSICDMASSLRCGSQLLEIGNATQDEDLVIMGHRATSAAHFWRGEFDAALASGDHVRRLYNADRHHHITTTTNNDPLSAEGVYRAQVLWLKGYPEQAIAISDEKDRNSRRRGHPFDIALSLTLGAQVFEYLRDADALMLRAEEVEAIATRHGLTVMTNVMAPINRALGLFHRGDFEQSASLLDLAISRFHATGHRVWLSYLRAREAEARAAAGETQRALDILESSIREVESYGENAHRAEIYRIHGKVLLAAGRLPEAEAELITALDIAGEQGALSWELRAALSLAQAWQRERSAEARELLQGTLARFTEGFSSRDLIDARNLLDRLPPV